MIRKTLLTLTLASLLAAPAFAGEIIRSKQETKATLVEYWSTHDSHGIEAVDTSATSLQNIGGRPYATFTVQARDRLTRLPLTIAMIYDVQDKRMYAVWPNAMNQFLKTGDPLILIKSALGAESVDLT